MRWMLIVWTQISLGIIISIKFIGKERNFHLLHWTFHGVVPFGLLFLTLWLVLDWIKSIMVFIIPFNMMSKYVRRKLWPMIPYFMRIPIQFFYLVLEWFLSNGFFFIYRYSKQTHYVLFTSCVSVTFIVRFLLFERNRLHIFWYGPPNYLVFPRLRW